MTTIALHHELTGPPDAPVLLLSGSLGTDLSMWDRQVAPLSERFRVLRYDQRGHGRSPVPPGPYAIADLGRDVVDLLDRLELDRAHVCGLSIGGMTAMWVAAHAPERLRGLVLLCTAAWFGPANPYGERAHAVRAHGLEPLAEATLERWFTPGFRQARPDVVERLRTGFLATPREGYAGCCEALAAMDLRDELPAIAAPTLVIAGADDPATPPDQGRRIAEAVAGARLEVVGPAAHLASIEQSELVNQLILDFLET